jgi:hypothetical protein
MRTQAGIRLAVGSVLAGALLTAGAAAANTGTALPRSLVGCWERQLPTVLGVPPGVWLISISSSGTVVAYPPGAPCSGGGRGELFATSFAATGTKMTIGAVPDCGKDGVYSWHLRGAKFTLHPIAEATCGGHRVAIFEGTWTKKPPG